MLEMKAKVLAIFSCGVLLVACSTEPEVEAPFPNTWASTMYYDGSITMRPDGTVSLVNVPVVPAGRECSAKSQELVTEEARYATVGSARYRIETSLGELFLGPDTQGLGSLNWEKLVIRLCGERGSLAAVTYSYGLNGSS